MTHWRFGLRGQVLAATAAALFAVVLASALVAAYFFVERQTEAQRSRAQAIADALSIQLERILALDITLQELQGFDDQCDEALQRHGGLAYALVVDPRGHLLFRNRRLGDPPPALREMPANVTVPFGPVDGGPVWVASPVHLDNGTVASTVLVGFPRTALLAERNALILHVLTAGSVALLLVLGLLYAGLSRVMVRPLGVIVGAVARLGAGDRDARVVLPAARDDELALLARTFNQLVETVGRREHELVAARDQAEQASRAKSQFLAVMSHELRTPLNAVLGMAEVLARSKPLTARQQRMVQQVRSSGRQLADIISDLLDLAVIEAGKLRVVTAAVVLRPLVEETVEMFREDAQQRDLELSLDIDPALPDRIVSDGQRVRQVLVNLLDNALKFTERGSVRVSVAPADGHVRFAVADTGLGIDEAFLPHLYDAFRQADGTLSRRFGGTGLGLTISRELCQALGGRIDVVSRPGRGSTFWFELPIQAATDPSGPPVADDAVAADTAASNAPVAVPPVGRRLQVLLVEDNEVNREFVEAGLDPQRWQLTLARDGPEGLLRLRERRWDAVLLDWQLPGIDGLSLLATLRESEARGGAARMPVIAVTAHAAPGDRETCLAAGADDYLAKPFTLAALEAALKRAVAHAAAARGASPRLPG